MKKFLYLLVCSLFILTLFSCTPQVIIEDKDEIQACCGDDFDAPPPPPPLPIGG